MDDLIEAIKQGDRDAVVRLLADDPGLAEREHEDVPVTLFALYWGKRDIGKLLVSKKKETTIFEAASFGDAARVRALLDRDGSLVNTFAPDGFQPLGLAAFFGQAEVAELLIARGAKPTERSRNEMKVTPLHSAIAGGHTRISRALIEAGADIDSKQRHGWTALMGAAEHGDKEIVELLLERGADAAAKNDEGMTAAAFARSRGSEDLARLIEARVKH